jgi:hypothetical protein
MEGKITKFLIYCIELYKTRFKMTGKDVMRIFIQYEIMDYIIECYGALHTTGPEYIIEDIAGLIKEKSS